MGEHPKRRKDKYNPYRISENDGRYYILFKDGQEQINELEISRELYEAFNTFELEDVSYLNVWDRHLEHSQLWDATLNERAAKVPESVEDIVFRRYEQEGLHKALEILTEVQQRRVELYYFEGLTYKQIAEIEGCTFQKVEKSIKAALKKLKNFLNRGEF